MVVYSNNGRNSTLHPETIYIRILCRMLQNDHALNKSFIRDWMKSFQSFGLNIVNGQQRARQGPYGKSSYEVIVIAITSN